MIIRVLGAGSWVLGALVLGATVSGATAQPPSTSSAELKQKFERRAEKIAARVDGAATGATPLSISPQAIGSRISIADASTASTIKLAIVYELFKQAELRQLNAVLNQVIKRNLKEGLTPGVFNDALPRFTVYVGGDDRGTWKGVLIEDEVGDGAPLLALAESGRIEDAGGEALALRLFKGELHRSEPKGETVARFAEGSFLVGVQDPVAHQNRFNNNYGQLSAEQLRARIADIEREGNKREVARLRVELARRWATPLAVVFFALLAVPLAVVARGARGSAYLITLGVFVAFYALSRLGLALAEGGLNAWCRRVHPRHGRWRAGHRVHPRAGPQRRGQAAVKKLLLLLLVACSGGPTCPS